MISKATMGIKLRTLTNVACFAAVMFLIGLMAAPAVKAGTWQKTTNAQQGVASFLSGQNNTSKLSGSILNRLISVDIHDVSLREGLKSVADEGDFKLVYSSKYVPSGKKVSLSEKHITVKKALDILLANTELGIKTTNRDQVVIVHRQSAVSSKEKVQTGTIKGAIIDGKTGKSMEGAFVYLKDVSKGAVTDQDGKYNIRNVAVGKYMLTASFIGYKTEKREIVVQANKTIVVNFKLNPGVKELAKIQVVATGFQNLSKKHTTGSVDVIPLNQLDKPTTNIATRLIGQVAGVQATVDENGVPTFQIRGLSTLDANQKPLVVVDGFPVKQGNYSLNSLFNGINPNNVKNITILKDAAAAAIWGSRASNGVIIIETKSGQKRTPLHVSVSSFVKFSPKFDLNYALGLASPKDAIKYEKILANNQWSYSKNNGTFSGVTQLYSGASTILNEYRLGNLSKAEMNQKLTRLTTLNNKDQIAKYLIANPVKQQYNVSISGGTNRMSHYVSLLYGHNQSNYQGTRDAKYQVNYKADAEITSWLDYNLNVSLLYQKDYRNGISMFDLKRIPAYKMLMKPDGTYNNIYKYYWPAMQRSVPMDQFPYAWTYNPVQEIRNRNVTTKMRNIRLQTGFTFHLLRGLSLDSKIQYTNISKHGRNMYNEHTFRVRQKVNEGSTWDRVTGNVTPHFPTGNLLTESFRSVYGYDLRNKLNFKRSFNSHHHINVIAGMDISSNVNENLSPPISYGYNPKTLTAGTPTHGMNWKGTFPVFFTQQINRSYGTTRHFSAYSNINYTYNNKYTLSGSYRVDASNFITTDPKNRFNPFWSAGFKWHLSNEKFMRDISWVNLLNLRLTYGYSGNFDRSVTVQPLLSYFPVSKQNIVTSTKARVQTIGNPELTWERTSTWDIGIDFSLFGGKIDGKLDVYRKYGKNLIASLMLPSVVGTSSQKLNDAEMLNRGIEITLGTYINMGKGMFWRGHVAFAYNQNKITKLFHLKYQSYDFETAYMDPSYGYVEGNNASDIWAYKYLGVDKNGQPQYQGPNGPLQLGYGAGLADARTFMLNQGPRIAPYTLGFTNRFHLHRFDVSFIITGQFGNIFKRQAFNYPVLGIGKVLPNSSLSRVLNADPDKIIPLPSKKTALLYGSYSAFANYMGYLFTSASWVRVQEISFSYNLPVKLFPSLRYANNLKLYAQVNNLYAFHVNPYGEDPRFPRGTLKPAPRFTFGLKLNF